MALLPIMKDGLPLMIGDPLLPAMADEGNECLCCEEDGGVPCAYCPDGLPASVTLTITGVTAGFGSICEQCGGLNGTYVLPSSGPDSCAYQLNLPLEDGVPCGEGLGAYTHFLLTVNVSSTTVTVSAVLTIGVTPFEGIGFSHTRTHENCEPDITLNKSMTAVGGIRNCDVTTSSVWSLAPT
jgi:hypothetical protein